MKKTVLTLMCAALLTLCACAGVPDGEDAKPDETTPEPTPQATFAPEEDGTYGRFPLVRCEKSYGNGNALIYPAVDDERYVSINNAIYRKIIAGIGTLDSAVYTYFNIMCNQDGILSLIISFYDMETSELYLKLPMTFDAATGMEIELQSCFNQRLEGWRSIMPDEVSVQAESRGIVLLSDVMPIEDGQLYYLTGKSFVLMYRPYEISTYSAGFPEFVVAFDTLKPYIAQESALMRLINDENSLTAA